MSLSNQQYLEQINLMTEKGSTVHYVRADSVNNTALSNKMKFILDEQIIETFNLNDIGEIDSPLKKDNSSERRLTQNSHSTYRENIN